MFKSSLLFAFLLAACSVQAQYTGPRLFLDVPSLYFHTPDVENTKHRVGAGVDVAMNVGTHWSVARLGLGTTFTFDPSSKEFNKTTLWGPFAILEAGAGMYRSNGNRCAKTHASAFTAIGKVGLRYDFNDKAIPTDPEKTPNKLDFTLGTELGYFYIVDEFRNTEVVLNAGYRTQAKVIFINFGFKFFLNFRARE